MKHSFPSWALGPRSAHPKFGGGVIIGGIEKVADRLIAIKDNFPEDLTSFHLLHELKTDIEEYAHLNSPNAISFKDLVAGIECGKYPRVAALTVPAFGIPGVENGSILSLDEEVAERARKLHIEAIEKAYELTLSDLGEGIVIWWPAFDSKSEYHCFDIPLLEDDEAWQRLVDFWVSVLDETQGVVHLEWKPAVPGDQDYINSIDRAIKFCCEVNAKLDYDAMLINNEWAHLLIGGCSVERGTLLTIEAGLFSGFFHANSAELAIVEIDPETGAVLKGAPGDDKDWFVGAGGSERWEDQLKAVQAIMKFDGNLIAEHDIDPSGDDPVEYYRKSRNNLEQMMLG